jgi:hypothetical protein
MARCLRVSDGDMGERDFEGQEVWQVQKGLKMEGGVVTWTETEQVGHDILWAMYSGECY